MFNWGMGDCGWGFWGPGWIGMLLVWVLLLVGIVYLVRALLAGRPASRSGQGSHQPLDILRERYARGEIDQPTYERIKTDLTT